MLTPTSDTEAEGVLHPPSTAHLPGDIRQLKTRGGAGAVALPAYPWQCQEEMKNKNKMIRIRKSIKHKQANVGAVPSEGD